jgi:hypothetical protein
MKPARSPVCLGCEKPFKADYRNAHHQTYCSAPTCKKVSKAASQKAWTTKPENRDYHSGPQAVTRVRDWQMAHPEYRDRQNAKRANALQDLCTAQVFDLKQESTIPPISEEIFISPVIPALQDFIVAQPHVFVGLIAHFFNVTLQDQISDITSSLQKLGEDIANGRGPDDFLKTSNLFRTNAADAGAVQLGGSAPGAG